MASARRHTSPKNRPRRVGPGGIDLENRPGAAASRQVSEFSAEVFRTRDVLQLLGISRRQLQYWAQTDLVEPSIKTQGGHHRYTFEDLVALKAVKRLIDAGVSVQRIRSGIRALREALPEVSLPLSDLTLVATGDVLLVLEQGADFHAIRGREWVFPVGDFRREVDAWRKLHTPRRVDPEPTAQGTVGSLKRA
ncbi:MAG: MerR family transcriptional regulator [Myxococcota bacterium]|nr:MerR family transcriptional regulator [Myxococcota bacterium]